MKLMTILKLLYEQWIDAIIDEVNDYQKEKVTSSTSISRAFNVFNQALYHIINAMSNQLIYIKLLRHYIMFLQ